MKKKILHVTPTDIHYDGRILKELKALANIEKYQLKAFGVYDNEGQDYEVKSLPYVRTFRLLSKKAKFLPRPIRYFLNLLEASMSLTIPAIRFRPDIIHCHDTLYLPIAVMLKRICKSKLIYDAHELESDKTGQSKILSKYSLLIEKWSWKNIDLLISVSPSILNWYNKNLGQKKTLLILNSPSLIPSDNKSIESNYLREKFNIPSEKKIFLYLGIINMGRGVDLYLNIFQNPNVNSHIVFMGYGDQVEDVKKVASMNHNIHFHPAVPYNQVVEIAKSADIGLCLIEAVSLSYYYSLPNKLFEYAFSGLFILASDFPDIKNLVESYGLGKCCEFSENEVLNAVKEIEVIEIKKNDTNLYPLSWQYQAEQLLNGYNELLTSQK